MGKPDPVSMGKCPRRAAWYGTGKGEPAVSDSNRDQVIFGRNAVLAFLEEAGSGRGSAGRGGSIKISKILVAQGGRPDVRLAKIHELARSSKIPLIACDRRKLDQVAGEGERHQGVIALVSSAIMWQLEDFLSKVEEDRQALAADGRSLDGYTVALLDGIEDPHNLGAIVRTAEAAGVKAVLLPQRRSAGLTGTVAKTSAGALATLPVVSVTNSVNALTAFKKAGFWVVGLDGSAEGLHTAADFKRPLVVVVGGEGEGLGRLVREHCDFLVRIPMFGRTESLNASVAAGIVFYEVVRQNARYESSRSGRPPAAQIDID